MGPKLQLFLAQLTNKQAVIISLVLTFIYYVSLYDDGNGIEKTIQNSKQTLMSEKAKVNKAKKRIADAKKFLEVREELGEKMDIVLNYIPVEYSVKDFKKNISGEAQIVGLGIVNIGDGAIEILDNGFLERMDLTVQFTGSFSQIMLFLSKLTQLKMIVTIESLSLTGKSRGVSSDPVVLNFTSQISTYRYLKESVPTKK